jgi:MFS family permease
MESVISVPATTTVPLRRNARFQTFWAGTVSATLGMAVGDVAYPLAIVTMTGSPGEAALFSAVQTTGMLVAGLPAGSLADRYDSRRLALAAHAVRVTAACTVAVALAGGWLTLPLLIAAAALLGAGFSVGSAANLLLLRSIVPGEQLTLALTQDEVRLNGASLAGPSLAGALYGLAHVMPFAFTAGAFFVALTMTAFLPARPARPARPKPTAAAPSETPPGETGPDSPAADGGMLAGIRELWSQPVLRAAVTLIMGLNTVSAGLELVLIVILRQQGVPSYAIGLALGVGSVGGLAGAPLVKPLHRLAPGVLLLATCGLAVPVYLLLAVPLGPWWAAGALFIGMLPIPAARVLADILIIRQAPPERRGRVVGAFMTLIAAGIPLGLGGCGLLLQYLPAWAAMLTMAAAMAAVTGCGLLSRDLRHARWPGQPLN